MGLNSVISTAGQSLEVFTTGIQVAGQNIANANTPGYIREELVLRPGVPFQRGSLIIGTGVVASGIQQKIDQFLELRIHGANSEFAAAQAREKIYQLLEGEIRELGTTDISTSLSNFLAAINDVVNQSESGPFRQVSVQEGEQFARDILELRRRLDTQRFAQVTKVDSLVAESNKLITEISRLNVSITKLEASGLLQSDAGGLRTQRYIALNRLTEIIPARYVERSSGSVDLFLGSDFLILAGEFQLLETTTEIDRGITIQNVQTTVTKTPVTGSNGELLGVMEGRDNVMGGFIDELDQYVSNFIYEFNRIHSSGEGLIGFTTVGATEKLDDAAATLNNAGLDFTPQHGSFQIKVFNTLTELTETTTINIDLDGIGADSTLTTLQADIAALANINASITSTGQLQITADPNYEFRFSNDTSGILASLGINTFFTGSNSSDIGVNSVVANDHRFLATGHGGGPSDNSNVIQLAEITTKPLSGLNNVSLDNFYDLTMSSLANLSSAESSLREGFGEFLTSLNNQKEQFSGVSLDEEALKIIQFQRAFQAAARIISTADEMFETLIRI